MSAKPLQHQVIEVMKRRVDAWRGFALGHAREAYPDQAPRYEPAAAAERRVSDTTMALLQHRVKPLQPLSDWTCDPPIPVREQSRIIRARLVVTKRRHKGFVGRRVLAHEHR